MPDSESRAFTIDGVQAEASSPIILAENLTKVYAAGRIDSAGGARQFR